MRKNNITIVGAGLVGSLLAIGLAKRGMRVGIYERRPDMRKATISAGRSINLALSERGWNALRAVGLEKSISRIVIPMHGRQIHMADGSQAFQAYGREGQCIYSVSRAQLNMELMNLAEAMGEDVSIHFDQKCVDVNLEQATITVQDANTREQKQIESDLVIGSDGAFSAVRSTMQHLDRFNYSQQYIEHGYKELCIPPTAEGLWKMDKHALHIWPRTNFMIIALPNLDGSFTCTLFFDYAGPYSFEQLKDEASVRAFFEKEFPDMFELIPDLMEQFFTNPIASLVTTKCYPWCYKEKVMLIGDAAHAIVPFFGQGMNAGFEDCTVLERLLTHYEEDWAKVLPDFQKERKPNADAIADLAYENFIEMRFKVAEPKFLLRKKIEKMISEMYPDQYVPKYSMVSFTTIPYAEALEAGKKQDAFFERIMALENIEENWNSTEVVTLIDIWLKEVNFFRS